jgi:sugar lactone lactonase YvrE
MSRTNFALTAELVVLLSVLAASTGCGPADSSAATLWRGTMDTLVSGTVVVSNPADGVWREETAWTVEEELRIGTLDGDGPDMFGNVGSLEVDDRGRIYVFDTQANELRVFGPSGEHVRTIGRQGGGPGEFESVIGMAWGPEGRLWTVDPGNARISLFDTLGTYLTSHRTIGNYIISPWPGGFDAAGNFYNYGIDTEAEPDDRMVLVRYDASMEPVDSVRLPRRQGEGEFFTLRSENSIMQSTIPYTGGFRWRLVPQQQIWFADLSEYRIYQRTMAGDTVRVISREYDHLPVTEADIDAAIERLDWFTRQGGKIDRTRFPSTKPALNTFFSDDVGRMWVSPVTDEEDTGRIWDVFDPDGRYLGQITLPFTLVRYPIPLFRDGMIYGVTEDELEVPYVVRARIDAG